MTRVSEETKGAIYDDFVAIYENDGDPNISAVAKAHGVSWGTAKKLADEAKEDVYLAIHAPPTPENPPVMTTEGNVRVVKLSPLPWWTRAWHTILRWFKGL